MRSASLSYVKEAVKER
jgi:hypothetical protein